MIFEVGDGPRLARRSVLALLALTLPAGCAAEPSAEPRAAENTALPSPLSATAVQGLGPAATATASPKPELTTEPTSAPTTDAPDVAPAAGKTAGWGGPVAFQPGRAMLGSYLALGGKSLTRSLALRRQQFGRGQRIVHVFYPWDGYVPRSEPAVSEDSVLMVSWHGTTYAPIVNGSSDRNIASVATRLAAMKRPILLRWGWEMNGNWFDWDGTHNGRNPAGYVTAWRRLHRIFRENGAGNVAWVWSPNWNSGPNVSWNKMANYYPGDDYVDWVGVSGYPFDGESPTTLFTGICDGYAARKPIILAETAAVDAGANTKAKWIRKLAAWAADTPSLGAVVWFDTDIQDGTSINFRPDTDGASLAAYRALANSARFAG